MPHLEYGLEAYGSSKSLGRLAKLQKWGMRTAMNSKYNAHTAPMFKQNNILKLEDLYKLKSRALLRAKIEGTTPTTVTNMFKYYEVKNRKQHYMEQHFPTTKFIDSLPSFCIPRIWNENRPNQLELNTRIFKRNEKVNILSKYNDKCEKKSCYTCST